MRMKKWVRKCMYSLGILYERSLIDRNGERWFLLGSFFNNDGLLDKFYGGFFFSFLALFW